MKSIQGSAQSKPRNLYNNPHDRISTINPAYDKADDKVHDNLYNNLHDNQYTSAIGLKDIKEYPQ